MCTHSPLVASFHTASAGWPQWSPGLSVDSSTEDLARKHTAITHMAHNSHSTAKPHTLNLELTNQTIIILFTAHI